MNNNKEKEDKLTFVKDSINYNVGIIQYIDQKTHLLLATNAILVPLVFDLINKLQKSFNLDNNQFSYNMGILGYYLSILFFIMSFVFSLYVIKARAPTLLEKTFFFGLDIIGDDLTSTLSCR